MQYTSHSSAWPVHSKLVFRTRHVIMSDRQTSEVNNDRHDYAQASPSKWRFQRIIAVFQKLLFRTCANILGLVRVAWPHQKGTGFGLQASVRKGQRTSEQHQCKGGCSVMSQERSCRGVCALHGYCCWPQGCAASWRLCESFWFVARLRCRCWLMLSSCAGG